MTIPGPLVPTPPDPFEPLVDPLAPGSRIYRVGSNARSIIAFNPGFGAPSRFAFFGTPTIPVLYAADTQECALAESLLHEIPASGGILRYNSYADTVMGRLTVTRQLRLAGFRGLGLRRLKITAQQISDTPATMYGRTVRWAEAAHAAGFDGVSWTSRLCNDARALVLFGDRARDAIEQDVSFGRVFMAGADLDWLIDICAPLHVNVLPLP